tara:strand:+ start:213 stop:845 length:633 start_codon:yes stop_codon:yes gene_type:complete
VSSKFKSHLQKNPYTTTFVAKDKLIIYLRPGRTAGTHITKFISPNSKEVTRSMFYKKGVDSWVENITDEDLDDYFKFTVVRNPFSRLYSAWSAFIVKRPLRVNPDFEKFVFERGPGNLMYEDGSFTNDHWFPQHNYAYFENNSFPFVDYIGKYENLKETLDYLKDFVPNYSYFATRKPNSHYKRFFEKKYFKEKVADIYRKDLELFGYEF